MQAEKLCYNDIAMPAIEAAGAYGRWPDFMERLVKKGTTKTMDEMQSCLDVLRNNDVDVDSAVDRLMGNDDLYLEFIKRLPDQLNLAAIREALTQKDAENFHFYLHALKGFAGNLGITEIADAAQAGLIEFRASQFRNVTKLEGLLEEIEASGGTCASALGEIEEIEQAGEENKEYE